MNQYKSHITFVGNADTIESLAKFELDFEFFCRPPKYLPDDEEILWCRKFWGTPCNRFNYRVLHKDAEKLIVSFTTLESLPLNVFKVLIDYYPELCIECDWENSQGESGTWVNSSPANSTDESHPLQS